MATTLAVSWKPFVKSKASAVATTITTMMSFSIPYSARPELPLRSS